MAEDGGSSGSETYRMHQLKVEMWNSTRKTSDSWWARSRSRT